MISFTCQADSKIPLDFVKHVVREYEMCGRTQIKVVIDCYINVNETVLRYLTKIQPIFNARKKYSLEANRNKTHLNDSSCLSHV